MVTRNLELWLDLLDHYPVFNEEDHSSHRHAWDFINTLMEGRLNARDIICLDGLLGIMPKTDDN